MSQQINLYDPSLLRKREFLTAANVAATALLLLLAMGAWGASLRARIAALDGESQSLAPLVKGLQDQLTAAANQLTAVKPDPRVEADLQAAKTSLGLRADIVAALKQGVGPESVDFAEYLRGFARQAPRGLWLTGFTIGAGGASMEIRGRMTDPALLPEYIRRLNGEKAFKGRAFAALTVTAGKAESPLPDAARGAGQAAAPAAAAPFHEFTLIPATPAGTALAASQTLAGVLPPDASQALERLR